MQVRNKHGQTNSGHPQHKNEGTRAAADPKSSTQRRGTPCLVRTVNCAVDKTELRKPLMAHVGQGSCGGRLHGNCAACLTTTKPSASAARAPPTLASAKYSTPAEGAEAGPSKRPEKTRGGREKGSGSHARPDNNAKLAILELMNESFVTT